MEAALFATTSTIQVSSRPLGYAVCALRDGALASRAPRCPSNMQPGAHVTDVHDQFRVATVNERTSILLAHKHEPCLGLRCVMNEVSYRTMPLLFLPVSATAPRMFSCELNITQRADLSWVRQLSVITTCVWIRGPHLRTVCHNRVTSELRNNVLTPPRCLAIVSVIHVQLRSH